jgi:hypothetical protein
MAGWLGAIFKVCLLLINAMAVLNEERFLARRAYPSNPFRLFFSDILIELSGMDVAFSTTTDLPTTL